MGKHLQRLHFLVEKAPEGSLFGGENDGSSMLGLNNMPLLPFGRFFEFFSSNKHKFAVTDVGEHGRRV